jgi:hypothetical protein
MRLRRNSSCGFRVARWIKGLMKHAAGIAAPRYSFRSSSIHSSMTQAAARQPSIDREL